MKKRLVFVYTRINGVVKVQLSRAAFPAGMTINQEIHRAMGLLVNGGVK